MNIRQTAIAFLAVVAIVLIFIFTPKYKITWVDSKNFIITEETSSLYKRSKGEEKYKWDRIALYSGGVVFISGILLFLLRNRQTNT